MYRILIVRTENLMGTEVPTRTPILTTRFSLDAKGTLSLLEKTMPNMKFEMVGPVADSVHN